MNTKQSNRIKILFINYRQMMEILVGRTRIINIPDFTKIIDIREQDIFSKGIHVLIEHPSFPEIPEGLQPPPFYEEVEVGRKTNRKLYFE